MPNGQVEILYFWWKKFVTRMTLQVRWNCICQGTSGSIDGWYFRSQLNSDSYDTALNSVSTILIIIKWGSFPLLSTQHRCETNDNQGSIQIQSSEELFFSPRWIIVIYLIIYQM